MSVFQKILRTGEGRTLKRLEQRVAEINAFEPELEELSDEQLAAKTVEFRERFEDGEELDSILPEAFAARAGGIQAHARACATSTSS